MTDNTAGHSVDGYVRFELSFALVTLVLCAALAATAMSNSLAADFFLDDFLIQSIVQEIQNPLDFFTRSHFFVEQLHRPLGVLSWWLLERLGGGASAQYAVNAALLSTNGWLLCLVLAKMRVPLPLSAMAGVVWVVHPGSIVFASWISNRYELMATALGLLALLLWLEYLQQRRMVTAWGAFWVTALALLSKESAVILLPIALAAALWQRDSTNTKTSKQLVLQCLGAGALILAAFFAYRYVLGIHMAAEIVSASSAVSWLNGIGRWWLYLPSFVLTTAVRSQPSMLWLVLPLTLLFGALWKVYQLQRHYVTKRDLLPLVIGGVVLALLPIVQIAHFTLTEVEFLTTEGHMTGMFVERFYYQCFMALLMFATGCLATVRLPSGTSASVKRLCRLAGVLLCMLLVIILVRKSLAVTEQFAPLTHSLSQIAGAAVDALEEDRPTDTAHCRVRFEATGNPVFAGFTEAMVKQIGYSNATIRQCNIESEGTQFISMTHRTRLSDYTLTVAPHEVPHVGQWYFLRPSLVRNINTPVTDRYVYDMQQRHFRKMTVGSMDAGSP